MASKKEFRKWNKPKAKRQYQREEVAKQREVDKQIDTMVSHILAAIEKRRHLEAYGRDELLIKLAQEAGLRLYDDGVDDKLQGYAKRLGGERYLAMKAALYLTIETYEDINLLVDKDSQVHTLRLESVATTPLRSKMIIEEDGRVPLSDHHRAQLVKWHEEVEQYV